MATPPNLTQIAFGASLDESTEDEVLDPAVGFPVSINTRQDRRGGVSKRLGFEATDNARFDFIIRNSGRRVFAHGKQAVPCVVGGGVALAGDPLYLPDLNVWSETYSKWSVPGKVPECDYRLLEWPPSIAADGTVYDIATAGGAIAISMGVTGSAPNAICQMAVIDARTGTTISSPTNLSGGDHGLALLANLADLGFMAVFYRNATTAIDVYYFDINTPSVGWVLLTNVAGSTSTVLPSICALDDRVAIVYATMGPNRILVKCVDHTGIIDAATIIADSTPLFVDVDGRSNDVLWIAYGVDGLSPPATRVTWVIALTPTSLSTIVGTKTTILDGATLPRICAGTTSQTARLWAMDAVSGLRVRTSSIDIVAGATHGIATTTIYNVMPSSRPFCRADRYYVTCVPSPTEFNAGGNAQGLCVLVDWTEDRPIWRPVANVEPGLIFGATFHGKTITLDANRYVTPCQVIKTGANAMLSIQILGQGTLSNPLIAFDFASRDRWQAVEHHDVTFLSGGVLSTFDGVKAVESGFMSRPNRPEIALSGTGLTGTWRWVAIYEDIDANGNWIVSGISDPTGATSVSNESVTLSVAPLSVSMRLGSYEGSGNGNSTRVAWYRTKNGGEAPYYRLGSTPNNPSLENMTFVDSTNDSDLGTRQQLYSPNLPSTPGNPLDRRAPRGLRHIVSFADMLVGSQGSSLYYSGQPVYGEGTWFSPVFEIPIAGANEITALAVQDGTLYVFKERSIYVVSGDIPADNGSSGGLGQPRLLSSDVGCINTNSLVETSLGVFFQSHRGIELLGRGSPNWIGEKVQRTLEQFPIVTSAVLDARNNIIRFSLAAAFDTNGSVVPYDAETSTGGGRDLVFDLALNDWQSVDDKTGSTEHQASQDACVITVNGESKYAWLAADGTVYVENDSSDANAYRENNGTWITMSVETGWFKVAGIQGRQMFNRVLLLARKRSATNLSLAIGYNYGLDFATAHTWTNDALDSLLTSGWPITQLQHSGNNDSEGQSVRVRITDGDPSLDGSNSGRGATWLALTLDITPRSGATDVPEEAS